MYAYLYIQYGESLPSYGTEGWVGLVSTSSGFEGCSHSGHNGRTSSSILMIYLSYEPLLNEASYPLLPCSGPPPCRD